MSRQIAVRPSEELVQFIDGVVAAGKASSRAAGVTRALARERRRVAADLDIAILLQEGADPGLDELAGFAVNVPLDDLD